MMTEAENRELAWDGEFLVEVLSTGNEAHLIVTKGLTAEDGHLPRIVGARFDPGCGRVVLEFDRPVPDQLFFMNVPPL